MQQQCKECCEECKFYLRYTYVFDEDKIDADCGECHRYPPALVASDEKAFPIVQKTWWCGEFQTN